MAWMILIMKLFSGMAMAWAAREMGASLRLYIPQSTPGKSINDILKTIVECVIVCVSLAVQKRITGYMFCSQYLDLIVCLRISFMPEVELYWKADHLLVFWVETEGVSFFQEEQPYRCGIFFDDCLLFKLNSKPDWWLDCSRSGWMYGETPAIGES